MYRVWVGGNILCCRWVCAERVPCQKIFVVVVVPYCFGDLCVSCLFVWASLALCELVIVCGSLWGIRLEHGGNSKECLWRFGKWIGLDGTVRSLMEL